MDNYTANYILKSIRYLQVTISRITREKYKEIKEDYLE